MEAVGLGDAVEHFGALQVAGCEWMIADVGDALMALWIKVACV